MLFLLPLLIALIAETKAQYTVTWLAIQQYHNQQYISMLRSNITQPDRLALNLEIALAQRITTERILLNVSLLRPPKGGLVHLLDLEFAACDFLEQRLQQKLLKLIYAAMALSTNLPKHCPIEAGYVIRSYNFRIGGNELPIVTPELNFYTNMTMLTAPPRKERILMLGIQGRILKSAKQR